MGIFQSVISIIKRGLGLNYVPRKYLTGVTNSLAASVPASMAVGDFVTVMAYSAASASCQATWKCTSTTAALPGAAVAGDVTGTAAGALYVLRTGANYYKFELIGLISVQAFGAIGDGVADDSAAITAAIAAASRIYVPVGQYRIASNINIATAGKLIFGEGPLSVLALSGNNRRGFNVTAGSFTLRSILIDGGKPTAGWETANNYDFGVRIGEGVGARINTIRIQDVTFKDIGLDGVYIENAGGVLVDENCQFINCRRWGVAIVGGTYGVSNTHILAKVFDCQSSGGPEGKAYPLGAIDIEPSGTGQTVNWTIVDGAQSLYGDIAVAPSSGAEVTNTTIRNVSVRNATLVAMNVGPSVVFDTCNISEGFFRVGYYSSVFTARPTVHNVTVNHSTKEILRNTDGRQNLLPRDIPCEFDATSISYASPATSTYVETFVDDVPASINEILRPAGGSGYLLFNFEIPVTISSGDQLFLAMEIDRVDGSADDIGVNWLRVTGGPFDRLMGDLPNGKGQWVFVSQITTQSYVTPTISIGISGGPTFSEDIKIRIRKAFLFVNPTVIDTRQMIARAKPTAKKYSGWTGATLNAYNVDAAIFSASTGQNLDTINGGVPGKKLSIGAIISTGTITIRDTSVSSGNIRLINGSTVAVQPASSAYGVELVYHSDGYWYQV